MNRGNFALEGDDEAKRNCCGLRGRGFDDFSRQDLRDIILHKNKVIADLEKHAYGSASWIDALNKGLKKANEIKGKVDKKPPKESDEEFRKRLEEFDKGSAPTEAWGADELNGDGFFDDIFKQRDKEAKENWDKKSPEEKLRAEIRQNVRVHQGQADFFNKRLYEKLAKLDADYESDLARRIADAKAMGRPVNESAISALRASRRKMAEDFTKEIAALGGAAAPTPTEPKVSPVAAAAAVLKPVREKIQNGIGDALYGKEDDPKKQKKGLLGISEEGKEESKKKVMKNIVVPIVKTARQFGKNVKDTANMIFNPSQYEADMKEERIQRIKKDEAQAGIVRDKTNPMIIIRKPRGLWKAETTDPTVEAYNTKRTAWWNRGAKTQEEQDKEVFYIRVPNPIFAAKLKPSMKELGDAKVKLWTGVQQLDPKISEDVDGTLKQLQDDEFIWIPEDRAKEIYGQLRQFVADKQDEGVAEGYEDEGWTKGDLKRFAKIDPRTLKGQELLEWKESKLALDRAQTQNALEKVNKDIADEEAKEGRVLVVGERPTILKADQARLAKMREAKERVLKRQKDLVLRGQQEFKDRMMFENAEKAKRDVEYYAKQKADAQGAIDQADADKAEFDAKPVAERIAILKSYLADANDMENADINEQIEQLQAEEASEKVENQAQGSVDLLQQAEVIGAEGGAKPTNPALYEKAKAIVNKSYPKHSAYRSGAYVKKYKEMGGEYEDEPDGKRPLERWFKEDWKSINKEGYPTYRPTKRISKDTPLTPEEIDPENLKLQVKEKQKIKGDRNLSAFKKRGGAEPVEMKQSDYFKEHANIVKLLKNTGNSLLSEAKDQQDEASAMAKKMGGADSESDEELEGAGAIEYTLNKAGMRLFNPTRDLSKAERQSFAPDYEAYGETEEQGRQNAFNLSRSMYDQSKAIELPDFKLLKDDTSLRFYRKDDEDVILVGIRGTDINSWTDLWTWAVIGVSADLRLTTRFQEDLAKMIAFQRDYPPSQFYYVGTGSSLAGSIADRFLELGLLEEAITYNPSIERKHLLDETILNHRVYLDTDPLFILMGQYSPNTEIRVNPNKTNYYNPSKEKDYLIKSHSIYPVYNPAFEGGGMEGSGKTYTLEEWKAIFDAKLEEKRKAIEAREAKKKQTAKAKRERAKARREERDEPPPLETPFRTSRVQKATPPKEPEPEKKEGRISLDGKILFYKGDEWKDLGATSYNIGNRFYSVEDPRDAEDMNLDFYNSRQVYSKTLKGDKVKLDLIGRLGEEKEPFQGLMKQVIKAEFPSVKVYRETMGIEAPKKPRFKIVAPASARVELREELVAEQPRSPAGEFAKPEETAVVAVSQAPQGAFMKLMKSPKLTEADRRLFMRIRETKMTPKMRAVLLGRSGLARKVMEIMGIDESAFQTKKAMLKIADTTEMRVKSETVRGIDAEKWIEIKELWKRLAGREVKDMLRRTGSSVEAKDSARKDLKRKMDWCVASLECVRDAISEDWQGAWTINQEGREVDADGDRFYSRGKVGTDVGKNKTPLLTIKDTRTTAEDTGQSCFSNPRKYNFRLGEKRVAILLWDDGEWGKNRSLDEMGSESFIIPMRILYGFFPLMGLPEPDCARMRTGEMKLVIDWKSMPLVSSYKSLTAKAKEEIQAKLRSEYIPKLNAFIDMSRSKLAEIIDVAMKEAVRDLR
jgi:hypothetical protein